MNKGSLIEGTVVGGDMSIFANRKERDRQLRKTDIFRAAEYVFATKGFHNATIQDIAKKAQYATGTVYLYFKDKDELYLSILEEKISNLLAITKQEIAKIIDAREKLEAFVRINLDFFKENQNFFRIFLLERNKFEVIKDKKFTHSEVVLSHQEYVVELIRSAQEQDIVRKDIAAARIADIFAAIFMTGIFDWLKEGSESRYKLEEMPGLILDAFLNGLGKKQ